LKFNIDKDNFINCLRKVQTITEKNPVNPIMSKMLLEAEEEKVVIKATNFEVGIITGCNANVRERGSSVIDAKKMYEIFKEMPKGDSWLEKKDTGWIEIKHENNILFNIAGMVDVEFPRIEIDEEMEFSEVYAKGILELIVSTVYATSQDRTRDVLRGIKLEKRGENMLMVATDGHRLALAERKILKDERLDIKKSVIIPESGAKEIKRLVEEMGEGGKVEIGIGEKSVVVKTKEETLVVRLIEGEFPDYSRVIPKGNKKSVVLGKRELIESLRRVGLVADEETRIVKMQFREGNLEISSKRMGFGDAKEDMQIDYGGESIELGLNGSYIMDILNVIGKEKVVWEIKDGKSPVLIKGEGVENVIAVIMPVAL
jgi:DNA polymerase-3 subunit beta